MKKCGNCRFYRAAGVPRSGWCTHPLRDEGHDLMMVRDAELACRDVHDRDMWQAGDGPDFEPPTVPQIHAGILVHEVIDGVF